MGVHPNGWFTMENPWKCMIWAYPYFRKPPYAFSHWLLSFSSGFYSPNSHVIPNLCPTTTTSSAHIHGAKISIIKCPNDLHEVTTRFSLQYMSKSSGITSIWYKHSSNIRKKVSSTICFYIEMQVSWNRATSKSSIYRWIFHDFPWNQPSIEVPLL